MTDTKNPDVTPDQAKAELARDDGQGLTTCWMCGAFHWVSSGSCPYCNAHLQHQCWSTKDGKPAATHENYALAYDRRAATLRQQAESYDAWARAHRTAAKGPLRCVQATVVNR
jgi:hypothetical protein